MSKYVAPNQYRLIARLAHDSPTVIKADVITILDFFARDELISNIAMSQNN